MQMDLKWVLEVEENGPMEKGMYNSENIDAPFGRLKTTMTF